MDKYLQTCQDIIIQGILHAFDLHIQRNRRRQRQGRDQQDAQQQEYYSTRQGCYIMKGHRFVCIGDGVGSGTQPP